ncbi:MAG: T9SS type A sorting domain-containing protein, partial [candidate division Zixibacteria bacterium]|nr:T9SS type A sorting domain-containing protein [candidate division Zixibacteria bacterium]
IIDITDPSNCITLGTTALSGDPHKGVRVRDGYAYVAVYHAGLEVIDVGDPNSPFSIGLADTPGNAWDVDIDGDFAFVTERESGLSVVDISNPSDPSLNSTYPINGVIHGVFASSNFVYVADGNSLEIFLREGTTSSLALDIGDVYSEPGQPVEVPITGLGFNDMEIAGVELHLAYNTDCLEYTNIVSDYLDDATINVVDGQIHILWENYLTPFMLPDESALLTLQFTILGELGQICEIDWADQNELVDPIGDPLAGIEYSPGSVEVTTFSDLAGNITYYDLTTFVADVTVNLEGEAQQETISDESGNYLFEDNPPGEYTICPSLADDDEAVTVGDIILIRRHIVQLELFDSPFNYIAADANGNGYVSVSDIIKLRRYLAELEDIPAGNWKFVDAAYEITEDNWADAPGCIDVTLEFTNISDLDFIGVRIGDVDRSWGSGGLILEAQTDSVTIDIVDGSGQIGEIIAIPITADGFTAVAGLELHLDYPENGLEIISIGHDNFDEPTINMGNGEIHLIWDDINDPVTVEDGEEIITLEFEILETALDTMPISFGINYVVDEYGTDYFVESRDGFAFAGPVFIGDENDNLPNSYGLAQNYPNPFNAQTTIKYNLPKSSQVSVAIYDILGNQIETLVSDNQPAGYHQIIWYAKDVSSGIYFYKIQAGDFNRAKKMILLK